MMVRRSQDLGGDMELNKQVESLRRATLEQREAAARAAPEQEAAQYTPFQKFMWCVVQVLRHAWLNIYPLLGVVVGVVFIVYVKQTREILADLQQDLIFVGVLGVWAASIWYSMRVLSSTDFPGDEEAHPAAIRVTPWLNGESPRIAPFAGLVIIACAASVFITENPSPNWIAPLAVGIVPVAWAAAWVGDRFAGLWRPLEPRPVYRLSLLVIAVSTAAIASYAWSTVPQPFKPAPQALHVEDWLLALCVALTLAPLALGRRSAAAQWAMAVAFFLWLWIVFRTAASHAGIWNKLPFLVLVLAGVGLWFTDRRRELLGIRQDAATRQFEVARQTFVALGVAVGLQVALVIALTIAPIPIGMRLGTLAILFLGLALLACFGIVWVFLPKYATLPSLAVVPLLWGTLAGNAPDYALPGTRFAKEPPVRPRLTEHFDQWLKQVPGGDDSPIFFVAAAGGGLRAAYWTATMLAAADDRTCGEFGRHIYAYSGVSGGSLGIAAYLAQRQVWESMHPVDRCQTGRRQEVRSMLRRDFLAPVAGSLLFVEMTQRFVPFSYLKDDRGTTLAKAWSAAWDHVFEHDKGKFDQPFLEVFAPGSSPAVFLNATAVETGRRVLATNVSRSSVPAAVDLFRPVRGLGALDTAGLTVRDAVLNSARFTYVSPAATVSACKEPAEDGTCPDYTKVWDRLVDGGYFENSGLATLSDVIRALNASEAKRRFIVIVIDNGNESELACPQRRAIDAEANDDPSALEVTALSGFTAPIEALLRVRESRGQLELRRVRAEFNCKEGRMLDWSLFGDHAERKEARAAGQEPALGWFLSQRSVKWIAQRANQVASQFPFRHAACHDEPLPKGHALVGEPTQANVLCLPSLASGATPGAPW
jgi:hypothetical protein